MRLNRFWCGAALGALAVVLLTSGCTESNKLNPGSGQISIQISTQNSATRFDTAFVGLLQIEAVPLDPAAAAAASINPVGIINSASRPGDIDFSIDGKQFIVPVTLGTGLWRIQRIQIDNATFIDFDPPPSQNTCAEFITSYSLPERVLLQQLGPDAVFQVDNSGRTSLTITMDGQKFLEGFQAGFFCVPFGVDGCGQAWCLRPDFGYNPSELDMRASEIFDFS